MTLDAGEINQRLQIIELLLNDRPYLSVLSNVIKHFANLDELVTFCHQLSRNNHLEQFKSTQKKILNIILMQNILNLTPHFKEVIKQQTKNIALFQNYFDVNFINSRIFRNFISDLRNKILKRFCFWMINLRRLSMR